MAIETVTGLIELLIGGIARGLVLAMLGVGITIVFGLGGVLNLAIGVFAVLGVLVTIEVLGIVDVLPLAIVVAIFAVGVFGLGIDRTLLSLVYRSEGEERILLGIFTTLGLMLALDGILYNTHASFYGLRSGIPSTSVGGIQIRGSSIAIIILSVIVFALLYYFFNRTKQGTATRTVLQDETGAILCGINPRRVQTLVFVLSAAIAAFAGILYSFAYQVSVASGFQFTIMAVIVSIVGGVTSILGAAIAGVLLGVIVALVSSFVGAYVAEVALFAVAIAVLILKPEQIT